MNSKTRFYVAMGLIEAIDFLDETLEHSSFAYIDLSMLEPDEVSRFYQMVEGDDDLELTHLERNRVQISMAERY